MKGSRRANRTTKRPGQPSERSVSRVLTFSTSIQPFKRMARDRWFERARRRQFSSWFPTLTRSTRSGSMHVVPFEVKCDLLLLQHDAVSRRAGSQGQRASI